MVPHPACQIGSSSRTFRSETTGSNHFLALSLIPMVSGSIYQVELRSNKAGDSLWTIQNFKSKIADSWARGGGPVNPLPTRRPKLATFDNFRCLRPIPDRTHGSDGPEVRRCSSISVDVRPDPPIFV